MKISDFIDSKFQYNWDFIETVPEFARLKECEQNPHWHKEGNAWEHTKRVCLAAQNMLFSETAKRPSYQKYVFLAAALFHDIGKGTTTKIGKDGNWHSYGHEFESERITRLLLWDENMFDREQVCSLVRLHMEPQFLFDKKNYLEKMVEWNNMTNVDTLIRLKKCDLYGSDQEDEVGKSIELSKLNTMQKIASSIDFYSVPMLNKMPWKYEKMWSDGTPTTVYLMIGISGAGKSTVIPNIAESESISDYTIVSRDRIREELGYCAQGEKVVLSSEQEDEVTKIFNDKLISAAESGKTIFIDNLNLKRKYRDSYKELLKKFPAKWIYVYVEAPNFEENIVRREGQVSSDTLKRMISNIEWPAPEEYDIMRVEITGK